MSPTVPTHGAFAADLDCRLCRQWAVIVVLPAVQLEFRVDRAAATLPYTLAMFGFAFGKSYSDEWRTGRASRRRW